MTTATLGGAMNIVNRGVGGAQRTVLITGVSRGLGRALALEMAKRGHTVIGCSRSQDKLDSLHSELSSSAFPAAQPDSNPSSPDRHLFMNVDVRSNSSVEELARAVVEKKGVPDIIGELPKLVASLLVFSLDADFTLNSAWPLPLINLEYNDENLRAPPGSGAKAAYISALPDVAIMRALHALGTINRNNRLWEVPVEEFDTVIDSNVKGIANMLRHFIPLMIERKQGIIVNMSSGWGRSAAAQYVSEIQSWRVVRVGKIGLRLRCRVYVLKHTFGLPIVLSIEVMHRSFKSLVVGFTQFWQVAPYCASKWAVEGLTRSVAKELPSGMAIVALNPGVINTDMLTSCFGSSSSLYQTPESWAPKAATMILNLTIADNGASLSV
ncbi:hypothetical protein RHGRI_014111 [Rhododendron griersonianum]|uniref:Uncharacterized protein n=1 Tax=Rhododendron griersonianum TaxID=479676 RepID=A0AAV6K8B9_9ERIC|nr:hypothetical protein RHGRI_014111 [Rhododendron griersonianum]